MELEDEAAGFIGGLAVVFGFVALPAHSDESVTVPVPLVDAVAVSHYESAKRQKEKPGSVILALHAVRRLPYATVVYYSVSVDASVSGPLEDYGYLVGRGGAQAHYSGTSVPMVPLSMWGIISCIARLVTSRVARCALASGGMVHRYGKWLLGIPGLVGLVLRRCLLMCRGLMSRLLIVFFS
ncbi:outer membrane protein A [Cutibacterium acnes JCM 18918]|nr:outer membrane protein A [Cutibacterium acnes JCM 18918]